MFASSVWKMTEVIHRLSKLARRLTAEACLGHGVGTVMEPLGRVRPNVGLRGGVRHRIIADPGSQVDVEGAWINDAVCIHKPLTSQLQNPERRWINGDTSINNMHP